MDTTICKFKRSNELGDVAAIQAVNVWYLLLRVRHILFNYNAQKSIKCQYKKSQKKKSLKEKK